MAVMCWRKRPWQLTSTLAVAVGLLAASATPTLAATGTPAPATGSAGSGHTAGVPLQSVPPAPTLPTRPLPVTGGAPAPAPAGVSAAALPVGASIDLKVLVVSRTGSEVELPAVTKTLDYLGTPYDVYNAGGPPGGLTADKLATGSHALYSGVILTDSSLGVTGGALSGPELTTLTSYEATFGIRQVTWYTFPNTYYGFTGTPTSTTAATPATYTAAGATVFSYVNAANPLTISNATTYLAPAATDANTTPLLTNGANALALVHTYPAEGNRMNLALTFDSNEFLTHNLVLGYGLVNWVNGGLYLGERHSYLEPQPDDILLASGDNTWPAGTLCTTSVDNPSLPTFRMSGTDLQKAVDWQKTVQANPVSAQVALEWPFNGDGTTGTPTDTLTPAVKTLQSNFKWISHTWDHENLDAIAHDPAVLELTYNNTAATTLGLIKFNSSRLITPDVSGLDNPAFLQAANEQGVRFLVSDTSIKGPTPKRSGDNPSPNAGRYNPSQPAILEVPRHPTNLYFNVTDPPGWLSEDNCLYPTGANGHVADYAALLDRESEVLLGYLLRGDMDPLMFHQPNVAAYDGTHSLLSDLLDATLTKYKQYETLPILSPALDEVGKKMAARMSYNAAGVTSSFVPNQSVTLTATHSTVVPVSGLTPRAPVPPSVTTETYGGQPISYVTLTANVPVTIQYGAGDPIDTKRAEPAMAFLGADVGGRVSHPDGGLSQQYQGGVIYYSPATGAHEVHGAILGKWAAMGAELSAVGYPTTDETATTAGGGRQNLFQNGSIYWSPTTGTYELHGLINAHYQAINGPIAIGLPQTDETTTPDGIGRYNHFTGGSIYWTPATGAHEVHGGIRDKWAALGWELGVAGYPTTDETATPDGTGRFNDFTGASIYWTPATGAHEVHGLIAAHYGELGGPTSLLGYPLTDETATPDGTGRYNHFTGGSIYWTPAIGAHEVHGLIAAHYAELGGPTGLLGFPLTDETATPDGTGRYNHFTGGSIYWTPATGAHEVHGAIREQWAAMGWERSVAGYPTTDETDIPGVPGGRMNAFSATNLVIYWSASTGAHETYGSIRQYYTDAAGGPAGRLGLPTSGEYAIPGGRASNFEHGVLSWNAATGQVRG